jgi:hypothetical protein
VRAEDLAPVFECGRVDVPRRVQSYVASDVRFVPNGSPMPAVIGVEPRCHATIDALELAVAAAMRIPRAEVRKRAAARQLVVALARSAGWSNGAQLGRALEMSRQAIAGMREVPPQWLAAASLCLADPRLAAPPVEGSSWSIAAAAGLSVPPAWRSADLTR